jgi:hypothetical protein
VPVTEFVAGVIPKAAHYQRDEGSPEIFVRKEIPHSS